MATENIIVEQKKVPTAHFNLKTRTLVIPVLKQELSNSLYDLFIGHEVGHALNTPEDGWHDSIKEVGVNRSILNVCEDVRIEKLIRRKFPGLKISFLKAYKELLEQDFFGIKDYNLQSLRLIDRINLHTKCGASLGIKFDAQEFELLTESENAETFDETVEVAKKIQDFMKEKAEKRKEQAKNNKVEDDEDGEFGEEEDEGQDDQDQDQNQDNGFDKEDADSSDFDEDSSGNSDEGQNRDDDIESITDNNFREKEKDLYEHSNDDYVYADIPQINSDEITLTFKELCKELRDKNSTANVKIPTDLFNQFRKDSSKIVAYLAKEFELRKNADQLKRASIAKTGDLNMSRIYAYQFTDDIFKKISIVPNGKSHGLVLYLDWSGSMRKHMNDTIKQLMTLVMFCKMVQIPYEVFAFTSQYTKMNKVFKVKPGQVVPHEFSLMNLFSSKMSSADFTLVANALLGGIWNGYLMDTKKYEGLYTDYSNFSLGNTPLNETIISAMDFVPKFQSKNKLQVVNTVFLTDGEGHPLSLGYDDPLRANSRHFNMIIRDPKTHVSMKAEYHHQNTSKAFLHILKQRTNCNIIGFRIMSNRDFREYTYRHLQGSDMELILDDFRKTKSFVAKSVGFDDYYMLKAEGLSTDEEELEVKSTTTRGLVSAFKKYTKGNIQNKVILNRFIGLIS